MTGRIEAAHSGMDAPPADVLIVNWNGGFFLRHLLPLTLRFTDPRHQISIWDNASRDDSRGLLRLYAKAFPERVRVYGSRSNIGHAEGLVRLLEVTSHEHVVFLDCDAAPLREGWVQELLRPVLGGAAAAGVPHINLDFVHPSCLCTSRATLSGLGVDIRPNYALTEAGEWAPEWRDVLEDLTVKARASERTLEFLPADGDFLFDGFGKLYGDGLLYHHWFGTRLTAHGGVEQVNRGRNRERFFKSLVSLERWLRDANLWSDGLAAGGRGGRYHYVVGRILRL